MRMPNYLDLNRSAPERLAALRAANSAAPLAAREWNLCNWHSAFAALDQGKQSDGTPIWYTHCGAEFRDEFCDEIEVNGYKLIDHQGWYTDGDYASETARGIVVRLPHGRFLAGYYLSMNGERVYFPRVYDELRDAIYAADEHARRIGEQESEYQNRWNAARRIEDEIAGKLARLSECLALRHKPAFRARMRREIQALIAAIRDKRDELKADYSDVEG